MQSMLSLGVDVAKAEVVVACSCHSFPVRTIPNQAPALRAFLETLPAGTRLALEATSSYPVLLADLPALRLHAKATGDQFDALLQAMDNEIAQLCQTLSGYREQAARLRSIVGIGPLTSTWLINLLNRVPFRNSDALIAFLGLDPRPWDSGQKRGRRRLSKRGPAEGRRLLFNAAMAAAKTQTWQPLYARYRQQGWSSTAALIIIARKLAASPSLSLKHKPLSSPPNSL